MFQGCVGITVSTQRYQMMHLNQSVLTSKSTLRNFYDKKSALDFLSKYPFRHLDFIV